MGRKILRNPQMQLGVLQNNEPLSPPYQKKHRNGSAETRPPPPKKTHRMKGTPTTRQTQVAANITTHSTTQRGSFHHLVFDVGFLYYFILLYRVNFCKSMAANGCFTVRDFLVANLFFFESVEILTTGRTGTIFLRIYK